MRTGRSALLIPAPKDDLCLAFANTRFWRGRDLPTETLGDIDALLNRRLAEAPDRETLARAKGGYAWEVKTIDVSAAGLLAPMLWSAADLLTNADRRRVRRCANDACLWLFVDESKAGTRRWCDMASCGNRAKSRRHYLKAKAG